MSDLQEKKWFVYIGDHHEGPFSLAELQEKMQQNVISSASYVWFEGMADWKQMTEVPECSVLLQPPVPPEQLGAADNVVSITPQLEDPPREILTPPPVEQPVLEEPVSEAPPPELATPVLEEVPPPVGSGPALEGYPSQAQAQAEGYGLETSPVELGAQPPLSLNSMEETGLISRASRRLRLVFGRLFKLAFVLVILFGLLGALAFVVSQGYLDSMIQSPKIKAALTSVSDIVMPYTAKLAEKYPPLAKIFSAIPPLPDVAPEDFKELSAAALSKTTPETFKIGLAVSKNDLFSPVFYMAANLPDRARFDLYVEGLPDTLLNQLSFSTQVEASLVKKLGKTAPVKFEGSKPIPRGQYVVYVVEAENQAPEVKQILGQLPALVSHSGLPLPQSVPQGRKVLLARSYFLGGPRDSAYAERLREFHDKLRAKAAAELAEVRQYAEYLNSQLGVTMKRFSELRKGAKPTPKQKKVWGDFHNQWVKFFATLGEQFKKWTALSLQNEFFYGMLYSQTQKAGELIDRVHSTQNLYFTTVVSPKSYDIQLGETTNQAQSAIAGLRAKIDQAGKIPPTANGMPRKDGL